MTEVELGIEGVDAAVEIGRGGFGVVYRATEQDLGRTVAVKVLLGDFDERARLRFDRERRAMGSLSGHPNIVTVHRSGFTEHDRPYLLMEYLEGGTIGDRLRSEGRLPWSDVVRLGTQIAGALATAHRSGVLHRDVKPGNILLSADGTAKLGDFGIARLHGAPETRSSVITASVAHAPPEVLGGERPDERADIYSLASTLFELIWGSPAFVAPDDESLVPMFSRIALDAPPDLRSVGAPDPVAEVINTAMSKDKDHRHPTAAAFAEALELARSASPVDRGSPGNLTTVVPPSESAWPMATIGHAIDPGTVIPRLTTGSPRSSPPLRIWAAIGAAASVLIVIAAVALWPSGRRETTQLGSVGSAATETTDVPATVSGEAVETTAPAAPTTPSTQTTQTTVASTPESPVANTRAVTNTSGAISVLVPSAWAQQTSDDSSLLVTTDLEAALADEWVKGVLLQAVRNTPDQNPGGFAPDVTLNQLIADSECIIRERGPYADASFGGSYAVLDQCGTSGLSHYYLVAAPADLSMVILVAVSFESPEEDPVVQLVLDSATWTLGLLP